MKNNKNRHKDRPKTNAEKRKVLFEHGSEIGIVDGKKIGARNSGSSKTKDVQCKSIVLFQLKELNKIEKLIRYINIFFKNIIIYKG